MEELVVIKKNIAVVTSKEIAEHFGKNHFHVLRDIEKFKKDVSNFGEMFKKGKNGRISKN